VFLRSSTIRTLFAKLLRIQSYIRCRDECGDYFSSDTVRGLHFNINCDLKRLSHSNFEDWSLALWVPECEIIELRKRRGSTKKLRI